MFQRIVLLFILSTMAFVSSWAETYISDVAVTACSKSGDIESAKQALRNAGFLNIIHQDVNDGAGGHYIYIGYKTTTHPSEAITLLAVTTSTTNGTSRYNSVRFNNKTYDMVPATRCGNSNGDLSQGASGWYLYIYFSRSHAGDIDEQMYTNLNVTGDRANGVPCYDILDGELRQKEYIANLNRGHRGKDLFLNAPKHYHSLEYAVGDEETHYHRCKVCNAQRAESHTSQGSVSYDNNEHWGTCSRCNGRIGRKPHTFERCSTSATEHSRVCSVCHFILRGNHQFGTCYAVDEDRHLSVCTDVMCGFSMEQPHNWSDSSTVIVEATYDHAGIRQRCCLDCAASRRETIPQLTQETGSSRSETDDQSNDEEETQNDSSIENPSSDELIDVYSLNGRRVLYHVSWSEAKEKMTHGQIYIINGKRYLAK